MTILEAIILGLVEGITEFLPVSSTGHLVLVASLLGLDQGDTADSTDALLIVIQGGAILAVLGLYRHAVGRMLRGLTGKDPDGLRLCRNLLIAFAPAAVFGPLLDTHIETYLFEPAPVLGALAAGGGLMLWIHHRKPATPEAPEESALVPDAEKYTAYKTMHAARTGMQLTVAAALCIGLLQCLAMWPGVSRSMITIVGGMLMGLSAARAAEFSFLLGLPTLGGACVYKLAGNLMGDGPNMFDELGVVPILIGTATATMSAALAITWLVAFLNRHGLAAFGWYRIALAAVLGVLVWMGTVRIGTDAATDQSTVAVTGDGGDTVPSARTSNATSPAPRLLACT
ncbi:MAG: undecaprenyl-diphosphate phosphatase [Phycisphaerales bacterium]|nr:undecaprenyl-diphosphate phosphatase [Phycisphaerales bacterium]